MSTFSFNQLYRTILVSPNTDFYSNCTFPLQALKTVLLWQLFLFLCSGASMSWSRYPVDKPYRLFLQSYLKNKPGSPTVSLQILWERHISEKKSEIHRFTGGKWVSGLYVLLAIGVEGWPTAQEIARNLFCLPKESIISIFLVCNGYVASNFRWLRTSD